MLETRPLGRICVFLPRAWSPSCSPQPGWAPGYFHGGLVDAGPLGIPPSCSASLPSGVFGAGGGEVAVVGVASSWGTAGWHCTAPNDANEVGLVLWACCCHLVHARPPNWCRHWGEAVLGGRNVLKCSTGAWCTHLAGTAASSVPGLSQFGAGRTVTAVLCGDPV